ncbi:MAG: tetratricopeptide repeat protein [Phycisphaerae bacterium]
MSVDSLMTISGMMASSGTSSIVRTGSASGATGSSFGPAFLLSESRTNYAQGLYDSLGALVASGRLREVPARPQQEVDSRTAALKAIAAKIDSGDARGGRADAMRLLEGRADDITALRLVAHSYLAERNYPSAEQYYMRASALAPDNVTLRQDVTIARELQRSDSDVLRYARRLIARPYERDTGMRLLLRLTDRSPDNAQAYLALSDGFTAARKPVQALVALHEAEVRADSEQAAEVIGRARDLARAYPDLGLPHDILGRALVKAGRFTDGVKALQRAVDLTPDNSGYVSDLANAYLGRAADRLARGDTRGAAPDLLAAERLDPFSSGLAEALGRAALLDARDDVKLGRYTGALKKLRTAAIKGPDDASFKRQVAALYTSVGAHYRDSQGTSTAYLAFSRAYELDPSSEVARKNFGELAHQLGLNARGNRQYDNAVDYLTEAYETQKTNVTYRKDLAIAYDARGQDLLSDNKLADAIEDFKRAYRLDPSNASIEANLTAAMS